MVEAIVDLTATGTTLREHDLIVREEIVECTARLIANPVAHKLRARGDRQAVGALACCVERGDAHTTAEQRADAAMTCDVSCGAVPRRLICAAVREGSKQAVATIVSHVRAEGDEAVLRVHAQLRHRWGAAARDVRAQRGARPGARADAARRGCRAAGGDRERRARRGRLDRRRQVAVDLAQGHTVSVARAASERSCRLRARGPRRLPEHGRDGCRDRSRRRRARRGGVHATRARRPGPSGDPGRLPAVRRGARVPHGRRSSDRGACLRHRVGGASGRGRGSRQPVRAGGQATALARRRHRRLRRARAT